MRLVHDPQETAPGIRGAKPSGNDGGQSYPWPHHNGAVADAQQWQEGRELYDIADILAFEDRGDHVYVAGDCTRAYSREKLQSWTRQVVYIRPGTFVIFDRVASVDPSFRKTWVLQAAKPPTGEAPNLVVTNGEGRLFVQTVLPQNPQVELFSGDKLYSYGGDQYDPTRQPPGPVPECRIEVSPSEASATGYFLHVLTATDAAVQSVPQATVDAEGDEIVVAAGETRLTFAKEAVGGSIEVDGQATAFPDEIVPTGDER